MFLRRLHQTRNGRTYTYFSLVETVRSPAGALTTRRWRSFKCGNTPSKRGWSPSEVTSTNTRYIGRIPRGRPQLDARANRQHYSRLIVDSGHKRTAISASLASCDPGLDFGLAMRV